MNKLEPSHHLDEIANCVYLGTKLVTLVLDKQKQNKSQKLAFSRIFFR